MNIQSAINEGTTILKNSYIKDHQTYINKEILLSKQINQLQINKLNNYDFVKNKIININNKKNFEI